MPSPWRVKFALLPELIARQNGRDIYAWFEFFEQRRYDRTTLQQRRLGGCNQDAVHIRYDPDPIS